MDPSVFFGQSRVTRLRLKAKPLSSWKQNVDCEVNFSEKTQPESKVARGKRAKVPEKETEVKDTVNSVRRISTRGGAKCLEERSKGSCKENTDAISDQKKRKGKSVSSQVVEDNRDGVNGPVYKNAKRSDVTGDPFNEYDFLVDENVVPVKKKRQRRVKPKEHDSDCDEPAKDCKKFFKSRPEGYLSKEKWMELVSWKPSKCIVKPKCPRKTSKKKLPPKMEAVKLTKCSNDIETALAKKSKVSLSSSFIAGTNYTSTPCKQAMTTNLQLAAMPKSSLLSKLPVHTMLKGSCPKPATLVPHSGEAIVKSATLTALSPSAANNARSPLSKSSISFSPGFAASSPAKSYVFDESVVEFENKQSLPTRMFSTHMGTVSTPAVDRYLTKRKPPQPSLGVVPSAVKAVNSGGNSIATSSKRQEDSLANNFGFDEEEEGDEMPISPAPKTAAPKSNQKNLTKHRNNTSVEKLKSKVSSVVSGTSLSKDSGPKPLTSVSQCGTVKKSAFDLSPAGSVLSKSSISLSPGLASSSPAKPRYAFDESIVEFENKQSFPTRMFSTYLGTVSTPAVDRYLTKRKLPQQSPSVTPSAVEGDAVKFVNSQGNSRETADHPSKSLKDALKNNFGFDDEELHKAPAISAPRIAHPTNQKSCINTDRTQLPIHKVQELLRGGIRMNASGNGCKSLKNAATPCNQRKLTDFVKATPHSSPFSTTSDTVPVTPTPVPLFGEEDLDSELPSPFMKPSRRSYDRFRAAKRIAYGDEVLSDDDAGDTADRAAIESTAPEKKKSRSYKKRTKPKDALFDQWANQLTSHFDEVQDVMLEVE